MRYPKEHKEQTKQKIVAAASRLFRERGLASVTVPEIMEDVGLTHGGFYSYFSSKEELLILAMQSALEAKLCAIAEVREQNGEYERFDAYSRRYLSPEHRDHPEMGCLFAALVSDLARESKEVRGKLAEGFQQVVENVESLLPPTVKKREEAALAQICLHVGAIVIARALAPSKKSDRILEIARKYSEALEPVSA